MATISEALANALQHHQAGRLQAAEQIYRRILAADPNHADATHLLGVVASQTGQHEVAVEHIRRAIALKGTNAVFHCNLGSELKALGNLDEAIASYRRALELKPDYAVAHFNLGNVLQTQSKLDEAVACYGRALDLKPDYTQAHNNLGNVFQAQARLDDSAECFRRALELKPDYAEAHYNLGVTFQALGKLGEAVAAYVRAVELKPDLHMAHSNMGNAMQTLGKLDEAVACYRRALELKPDLPEAHNNLGTSLQALARLDEAFACFRRALELKPSLVEAHSNLLFALPFSPDCDAAAIFDEQLRFNRQHAEPLARCIEPHDNVADPNRRLRVGYVSPHFRDHCQAFFTLPLFSSHDHQNFEIFCYSDVARSDDITDRVRSLTDGWQNITGLSSEQVAQRIRQDQIDILVDLTMHMERNHLLLFARKPAPMQVCWLAYPGTTGLTAMDYRLTDPYLDPPGLHDAYYSEQSIRLPDCFWCYDPLAIGPAVNSLPALKKGHVTFGCLNNFCKVTASVLELWARVLGTVERSRLLLLAPQGSAREFVLRVLGSAGISPDRIAFVGRQSRLAYLELYNQMDIGLDTFPYNGHTTSLDAYWMGVPVVTLVGKTAVGRAGLCQLHNLGLPELVAHTPEQFAEISCRLAGDLPRLSQLRAMLREKLRKSPLMDAPRFARNIEAAYRAAWQRWCAQAKTS